MEGWDSRTYFQCFNVDCFLSLFKGNIVIFSV